MLRFDKLIRASMIIRDVKHQHPQTTAVFEAFGFRPVCDDCSIHTGAARQGIDPDEIVDALNQAIQREEARCE